MSSSDVMYRSVDTLGSAFELALNAGIIVPPAQEQSHNIQAPYHNWDNFWVPEAIEHMAGRFELLRGEGAEELGVRMINSLREKYPEAHPEDLVVALWDFINDKTMVSRQEREKEKSFRRFVSRLNVTDPNLRSVLLEV